MREVACLCHHVGGWEEAAQQKRGTLAAANEMKKVKGMDLPLLEEEEEDLYDQVEQGTVSLALGCLAARAAEEKRKQAMA